MANDPQAEDIAFGTVGFVVLFAIDYFRRHISHRSTSFKDAAFITLICVNDDILRLYISVDDVSAVTLLQYQQQINNHSFYFRQFHMPLLLEDSHEVFPWQVLEDENMLILHFIELYKL